MAVEVNELGFGLQADWLTPASRCFRPTSWPPARDWVVSEAKDGHILSRWGDPIWDLSPIAGKAFTLNFGDGPVRVSTPIDPANSDLLRLIITWFLWGHRPIKTANNLVQVFQCIRPIIALCSKRGILASDLMRFPKVFEEIPSIIAPSIYSYMITRLHRLLDAQETLGFTMVDAEGLVRLTEASPDHKRVQTAYIPPRIWEYQVNRLRECLDDFIKHRQSIQNCFNFCVDAYAHNYGSLENALTTKPINSRLPFQAPSSPNVGIKSGCLYYGPFHLTAQRFEIDGLFGKWLILPNNRVELRQLSSHLTLIQWVGLAYVASFTLQRIEEVATLRADCLQFELDEKLGRIPIICGETTKTVQDSDARWPTSPSVQIAIEVLNYVAQLRMRCIKANPLVYSSLDEINNPYLFTKSFEPWSPKSKKK